MHLSHVVALLAHLSLELSAAAGACVHGEPLNDWLTKAYQGGLHGCVFEERANSTPARPTHMAATGSATHHVCRGLWP